MNTVHDISLRVAVVLMPVLLLAVSLNRGGAPAFSTGAPGEGTCAACHTGNPVNDEAGSLQLTAPAMYTPGETLDVTVRAVRPAAARFGFQITAKDGTGSPVGSFDVSAENIQLALGSQDHVTHAPAADSDGEFQWVIPWEAPSVGAGEVTFYAAANMANADFTTSGDFIYTAQRTLMQADATDTDRLDGAFPSRFAVGSAYPNPIASHVRLHIPMEGRPSGRVYVRIFDLSGRLLQSGPYGDATGAVHGSSLEVQTEGLTPGVYMAQIQDGPSVHTVPFVVVVR